MSFSLQQIQKRTEWVYWLLYFLSSFIELYLIYLGHGHWLTNHVLLGLLVNAVTSFFETATHSIKEDHPNAPLYQRFWHRFHYKSPYYAGMSLFIYLALSATHTTEAWWLFSLFFAARHSLIPIFAVDFIILFNDIWNITTIPKISHDPQTNIISADDLTESKKAISNKINSNSSEISHDPQTKTLSASDKTKSKEVPFTDQTMEIIKGRS